MMYGTVVELPSNSHMDNQGRIVFDYLMTVWVQLDGDCRVPLLCGEFHRFGVAPRHGMRVEVCTWDICPYLVAILNERNQPVVVEVPAKADWSNEGF